MAAHAQQAENRNTGPYINKTNCPKRATARPTKTNDPQWKGNTQGTFYEQESNMWKPIFGEMT